MAKYSVDSDVATDYLDRTPLIPPKRGKTLFAVESLLYVESEKDFEKKFYVFEGVALATTQDGVELESKYRRMFILPTNKKNEGPRMRELRSAIAAIEGKDPKDKTLKLQPVLDELEEKSAKEVDLGKFVWFEVSEINEVERDDGTIAEYPNFRYHAAKPEEVEAALTALAE